MARNNIPWGQIALYGGGGYLLLTTMAKGTLEKVFPGSTTWARDILGSLSIPAPGSGGGGTSTPSDPGTGPNSGCPFIPGRRYVAMGPDGRYYQLVWGGKVIAESLWVNALEGIYNQKAFENCASGA